MNSKNCVAWTIEYGIDESLMLFLRHLGAEVAALGQPLGSHHRQRDAVRHTGGSSRLEKISRRGREEVHDRCDSPNLMDESDKSHL